MPGLDERGLVLLAALALDALVGDPAWAWSRVPHPVALIGRAIGWLDRSWNREDLRPRARRLRGVAAALLVPAGAALAGWMLAAAFAQTGAGPALEAAAAAIFLAQRSLYDHVAAVAAGLESAGLEGGRAAVAMIVGRDPASLDEPGICRAAFESLAENLSDGVTAPAFWYLVAGLPGLLAYKAINTADSMVGHRSPRHEAYGWASARLDDLANLAPARLAGLVLALAAPLAGGSLPRAFRAMRADAARHSSPNAGWPEAAMAGALGLALAGPRTYRGVATPAAWMNAEGRRDARAGDIRAALRLFVAACLVQAALLAALVAAL